MLSEISVYHPPLITPAMRPAVCGVWDPHFFLRKELMAFITWSWPYHCLWVAVVSWACLLL